MDEETAAFYQMHLNIVPKHQKFAYEFIYHIIFMINESKREDRWKNILSFI